MYAIRSYYAPLIFCQCDYGGYYPTLTGDLDGDGRAEILAEYSPSVEIYSIDEAFLELQSSFAGDLSRYGQHIRQKVLQWTGPTVGVGIGPTRTLAKLANYARITSYNVCYTKLLRLVLLNSTWNHYHSSRW